MPGDGAPLAASASLTWTKAKHVESDSHSAQHAPRLSTFAPSEKLAEREAAVTSVCAAGAAQLARRAARAGELEHPHLDRREHRRVPARLHAQLHRLLALCRAAAARGRATQRVA